MVIIGRGSQSGRMVEEQMGEHYLEFRLRKWVEIQRKDLAVRVYRDDKLFGTLKAP